MISIIVLEFGREMNKLTLTLFLLLISVNAITQEKLSTHKWQSAKASDMQVFAPYIGRFKSETSFHPQLKKNIHFIIDYDWFDRSHKIVAYRVSYFIEDENKLVINAQGYYGYDSIDKKLFNVQVNVFGGSSFGWIKNFDVSSHTRENFGRFVDQKGRLTYIRDVFKVVDKNSWSNVTYRRLESEEKWQQLSAETFTRTGNKDEKDNP